MSQQTRCVLPLGHSGKHIMTLSEMPSGTGECMVRRWRVSYRYVNPHGAGPFKGKDTIFRPTKPVKGEEIYAMFGRATITTVSEDRK